MSDRETTTSQTTSHADVIVIGAGIIGAACADALARRGLRGVMIDKGEVGYGCSFGNAGWITPCFALPLAMPGMLLKSIGWMLDSRSPFYIEPRPSLDLAKWLFRFLRSMNQPLMERSTAALVPLAKASLEAYRQLAAESASAIGFQQKGLLMVAQTPSGLDAARQEMELVAVHGVRGQMIDERGVRELEPAITGGPVAGAVLFPDEAHCEPLQAVLSLTERAKRHGAVVCAKTEVFDVETDGGNITALRTTRGRLTADQYVLATGAWSARLGEQLGVRIPLMSGKGYGMTVTGMQPPPRMPLMFIEKKCAVTPRENGVRIAGTLELVGLNDSISTQRVQSLAQSAAAMLNMAATQTIEVWRGLRPCTPDGVPVIGRPRGFNNLVIATGHQMLGLLTAPATGTLVADLIHRQAPSFDPNPFCPNRF